MKPGHARATAIAVLMGSASMVLLAARPSSGTQAPEGGAVAARTSTTSPVLMRDTFERFAPDESWADETRHRNWFVQYGGFGSVGTSKDDTIVHRQAPQASKKNSETHASLVTSTTKFTDFDATIRLNTVQQLRTPTPNAWETAWVLWHYTHDEHFYYFIPKPNGWELGKVDNSKVDPDGPECFWPSYENCKYQGAQRYLRTGSSPTFPVGSWYTVRVKQVGRAMTVWVDGKRIVSFTDRNNVYTRGSLGLYNEDAAVLFDDVRVATP